jgi:hypothetical protein
MLGQYENFPETIHLSETYASTLSRQKLQQKLVYVFQELNGRAFSFEEIGNPAVPNCSVIFMFGIADTDGFKFLNEAQTQRLHEAISSGSLHAMDWFCGIRYYKNTQPKRTPLKFDYYVLRITFTERDTMQFQVSHERGPRYISPEEFVSFIVDTLNSKSRRKTLQRKNED